MARGPPREGRRGTRGLPSSLRVFFWYPRSFPWGDIPKRRDYAAIAEEVVASNRPLLALEFHPAAIAALDAFIGLRLDPGHAAIGRDRLLLEADALAAWGEHASALAAFERALELDPASAAGLLGKGRALSALRRTDECREWWDGFAGRGDCEPERRRLLARAADEAGDVVAAHQLYDGLKDHPRLPAESRAVAGTRAREWPAIPGSAWRRSRACPTSRPRCPPTRGSTPTNRARGAVAGAGGRPGLARPHGGGAGVPASRGLARARGGEELRPRGGRAGPPEPPRRGHRCARP